MAQIGLEVGLFMNLLVSRKKLLGNTGDFLWSYGGYLIVSALCDLCGVVLDESNARNFITDCIESLHDTLKANLSVDGANYSLSFSDDFINEFIEFYLNISGKQYLYNEGDEYEDVTGGIVESERDGYENKGITKNEKNIVLDTKNSQGYSGIKIINPIDLSLYTSIHVDYKITSTIRGNFNWFAGYFQKDNLAYDESKVIKLFLTVSSGNTVTCNPSLTDVNEVGYLTIYASAYGLQSSMVIYKIWLEKKYDIGDSYVKTLEEYKAKYENEPSKIILDSSIVNIKTKWKKEDTDIYIPNGNVENLPSGVNVAYRQYLFKEGDQCTNITGGWKDYYLSGAQFTDTCILLSQSETHNMFAGTVNEIDFSKYTRMYLDMESTNYCYLLNKTSLSAALVSAYTKGNRKIVSFSLEDKKISTIIYCAIFNPGTAKIYNIWLE